MLKWHPASVSGDRFSVAQVAAFGTSLRSHTARTAGRNQVAREGDEQVTDGKDLADGKSILDNKDIPAEGLGEERPPGEGPPPALPDVPPFTFIPQGPGSGPAVPPTSP